MTQHLYLMDDAVLPVPAGFSDRTSHVLDWVVEGGDRLVLIVSRQPLAKPPVEPAHHHHHGAPAPEDGAATDPFDRFVARKMRSDASEFPSYKLEVDERSAVFGSFPMRRVAFRWRHEQDVLYQHEVFVALGDQVLVVTSSAKAMHREAVVRIAEDAAAGLRARQEDDAS